MSRDQGEISMRSLRQPNTPPAQTVSSETLPNRWQPFQPSSAAGRPELVDSVKLTRTGAVRLSGDIADRLGWPKMLQLLTDGSRDTFAICPATTPAGATTLSKGERRAEFRANRLLVSLGKDAHRMVWSTDLPHEWDGDVLVIDIADVPDTEGAP